MSQPKQFNFSFLSPARDWYHGPATALRLATETGNLEIYPGHGSFVGIVDFTKVAVENGDVTLDFIARHGTLVVEEGGHEVRLMAQDVQLKDEIDVKTIEEYLQYILSKLSDPAALSKHQIDFLTEQKDSLERTVVSLKLNAPNKETR